ncbi:MAG: hypothetical protein HQM11_07755 [SAR324 cluster bacterium]|nr:hypothetical protein [SAR324 cluster bacterium]
MFQGVVPEGFRKILTKYIPLFSEQLYVLCCGNFTTETVLSLNGYKGEIHSCDVSIYSCVLGWYFNDQPFSLEYVDAECKVPFIQDYLNTPARMAATVMLLLDMADYHALNNSYKQRMWNAYVKSWDSLVEQTIQKLETRKSQMKLTKFHGRDAMAMLDDLPTGATVTTYAPTYSGGYERMYKWLNTILKWDPPTYTSLDSPEPFYRKIVERDDLRWFIYSENELHGKYDFLGDPISALDKRSLTIHLYSNIAKKSFYLGFHTHKGKCPYEMHISDEINPDDDLQVILSNSMVVDYIRTLYLKKTIKFSGGTFNFLVTVNSKIIGVICAELPTLTMNNEDGEPLENSLYLLCDMAVNHTVYKRLSKLVLLASLSKEFQTMMERKAVNKFDYTVTTAFSKNPVSMKYRGIYKLITRKEQQDEDHPYVLNYYGVMGQMTLKQALQKWCKHHRSK